MLRFGVTVLPDPPHQRLVELVVKAEKLGFHSGWTYDSPILWQEPYPLITLLAANTTTMNIGMCPRGRLRWRCISCFRCSGSRDSNTT